MWDTHGVDLDGPVMLYNNVIRFELLKSVMSVFHRSSNSHHSNPASAYTSPGKINLNCTITGDTIFNGSQC